MGLLNPGSSCSHTRDGPGVDFLGRGNVGGLADKIVYFGLLMLG